MKRWVLVDTNSSNLNTSKNSDSNNPVKIQILYLSVAGDIKSLGKDPWGEGQQQRSRCPCGQELKLFVVLEVLHLSASMQWWYLCPQGRLFYTFLPLPGRLKIKDSVTLIEDACKINCFLDGGKYYLGVYYMHLIYREVCLASHWT